jgi:hypothetical protein
VLDRDGHFGQSALMGRTRLLVTAIMLLMCVAACDAGGSSECNPYEQFRLNGTLYLGPSEDIGASQLGDEAGEITKPLPDGAVRCEPFTLVDGQGTPSPGSKVYEISGTDPAVALAVVDASTGRPRLYRTQMTAP